MIPAVDVFLTALKLGLTSFGGPIAHLGRFHREYVERRAWLNAEEFAELVAVCQFLPGPTSSQVGLAIGRRRAGWWGALGAWAGFTLPSALVMAFAGALWGSGLAPWPWLLWGLETLALVVVTQAVITMGRRLLTSPGRWALGAGTLAAVLVLPPVWVPLVLALAGCGGLGLKSTVAEVEAPTRGSLAGATWAAAALVAFVGGLTLVQALWPQELTGLAAGLARAGSLVFGGGHVILPLLGAELVPQTVSAADLAAGYGLAQLVPGPLFTVGVFLGALVGGPLGALVGLALFVPGCLLVFVALPVWERVRTRGRVRAVVAGLNAGVVGLLAAALWNPLLVSWGRGGLW